MPAPGPKTKRQRIIRLDASKLPFKLTLSILGVFSFGVLLCNYGFRNLVREVSAAGWLSGLLIFSFIPTLGCYAMAWLLVTDLDMRRPFKRTLWSFFSMSAQSIAWNNLTPFLKIGGEAIKVINLTPMLGRRAAIKSVVVYNLVHLLGTVASFIVAAGCIPYLFWLPAEVKFGCFIIAVLCSFIFMAIAVSPKFAKRWAMRTDVGGLQRLIRWLRWSMWETARFCQRYPLRFAVAVVLEVVARFVEGLTCYLAFQLIQMPIPLLTALFVDVGRTLIDTLFFFIPYQVGSREAGVAFMLQNVFTAPSEGFITATLLYRFVEISWIIVGYGLWLVWERGKQARIHGSGVLQNL